MSAKDAAHLPHGDFLLPAKQAAALSSLGGFAADLEGVIANCDYLEELDDLANMNFLVWEAVSAASVVRYCRCFNEGLRTAQVRLSRVIAQAPAHLKDAHEYFKLVRDKHVAHSVNDYEQNDVVVRIDESLRESDEIRHIFLQHGRIFGLSFNDPALLRELARWVLERVNELIESEKQKLLMLVRKTPMARLKALARPELGRGGSRDRADKRRDRP